MTDSKILRQLNDDELKLYWHYVKMYNLILDKLNNKLKLTVEEDDFICGRPHSINDWLDVDLIEREITLIDYRM